MNISLRTKLICIFAAMTMMVVGCSLVMVWNTRQVTGMFGRVVQKDLVQYRTAQEMEMALADQKGLLTYYFVDGNKEWLEAVDRFHSMFQRKLKKAQSLHFAPEQKDILEQIVVEYEKYGQIKERAIHDYQAGKSMEGISNSHAQQRDVFFSLLTLCKTLREQQWRVIQETEKTATHGAAKITFLAYWCIGVFVVLCLLFFSVLYKQILQPIRDLAIETGSTPQDSYMNEVGSLSHSLKGMMREFDRTHDELKKSKRNLLHAERMAVVGELAASVAHSMRNPFTSIKMRMFSLSRSLDLNDAQNEDLHVISDEIDRIDKIVTAFLEFARPPKLQFKEYRLGDLISSVANLLKYRLEQYDTVLVVESVDNEATIWMDRDRIREVLVNLITNSCEAMKDGGEIYIRQTREQDPLLGELAVLRITDTGPGIPEPIIHKITTPFFTTKEHGSGLGLSIVARIVDEHKGRLLVSSTENGAEVIIKIPVSRSVHELDSHH
jgi:signal transduction histidine kinase